MCLYKLRNASDYFLYMASGRAHAFIIIIISLLHIRHATGVAVTQTKQLDANPIYAYAISKYSAIDLQKFIILYNALMTK